MAIVSFWSKLFPKKEEPLRGAPDVRRFKTYSAESGFVYLYSFSGIRMTHREDAVGTEYVFEVTADRKKWWPASVFLSHSTLNAWMRENGRDLSASERYGIAKLSLIQMLDSLQDPAGTAVTTAPGTCDLSAIAETLDLL